MVLLPACLLAAAFLPGTEALSRIQVLAGAFHELISDQPSPAPHHGVVDGGLRRAGFGGEAAATAPDAATRPVPHPHRKHQVEHSRILNNQSFWLLSAGVVVGMGMLIMRYDDNLDSGTAAQKEQDESSSQNYAAHLLFCFVALNAAQILWGISQEYVMTKVAQGAETLTYFSMFLVLCNRLCTCIFTGAILRTRGQALFFQGFEGATWPALSNVVASWSQYTSLSYVSFTLQTAGKSSKIVPVFLISALRGKRYSIQDYAEVLVLCVALCVFGLETISHDSGHKGTSGIGIFLLALNVFSDSLTPHLQDMMYKKEKHVDALQATFATSLCAAISLAVVLICLGELPAQLEFVASKKTAAFHIMVLTVSSAITQYLINYTVKHFGPVVFTLIATTRQVISVVISAILFHHYLSFLAIASMVLVFGTLIVRALRNLFHLRRRQRQEETFETSSQLGLAGQLLVQQTGDQNSWDYSDYAAMNFMTRHSMFVLCMVSIMFCMGVEGIIQEFLTVHTFGGELFGCPVFLIAMYKTVGAILALIVVAAWRGWPAVWCRELRLVVLPGMSRDVATLMQYEALFADTVPACLALKSLKVLPTMLIGSALKNRRYSLMDYVEAFLVTVMVGLFVWDFHHINFEIDDQVEDNNISNSTHQYLWSVPTTWFVWFKQPKMWTGVLLMSGYLFCSALSCNLEDYAYQASSIVPLQQTLGMEMISSVVFWPLAFATGEVLEALHFIQANPHVFSYICLLGLTTALSTYVCTVTVKLYGPAITTGIQVTRQLLSLILSVGIFGHQMNVLCAVCLGGVSVLVLASCVRQITTQVSRAEKMPSADQAESKDPCPEKIPED